jgi:hypothetical protein
MSNGNQPAAKVAQGVGVAAPPPVLPFPPTSPYPWSGATDGTLTKLLNAACSDAANVSRLGDHPHVPFSMIALGTGGHHRYAGFHDDEMCFSASLLKVAVMYAAFELRAAANRLVAAQSITSQDALEKALAGTFDSVIRKKALSRINALDAAAAHYGDIFQFTGQPAPQGPVAFTPTVGAKTGFQDALHDMVVVSSDDGASQCINALGFSYLNALFMTAGFFTPGKLRGDERGIWVAGDFEQARQSRIRAVNEIDDQTGAYVMTTEAMCRLMAMIATGQLVNDTAVQGTSNQEMQQLLIDTATSGNAPFIKDVAAVQPFALTMNKLGLAHLGRREQGAAVASEGSVLTWKTDAASDPQGDIAKALAKQNLTGTLVICWQNVHDAEIHRKYDAIADIVTQTYNGLLNQP